MEKEFLTKQINISNYPIPKEFGFLEVIKTYGEKIW